MSGGTTVVQRQTSSGVQYPQVSIQNVNTLQVPPMQQQLPETVYMSQQPAAGGILGPALGQMREGGILCMFGGPDGIIMSSFREGVASYLYLTLSIAFAASGVYTNRADIAIAEAFAYASICFIFRALANPVLSFALLLSNPSFMQCKYFFCQIICQFVGALVASVTVHYGFMLNVANAVPALGPGFPEWVGFIAEMIGAYIISFCAIVVMFKKMAGLRPLFIGLCLGAISFAIGPVTTGCVNLFRAIGPSIITSFNSEAWIYYAGPLVGAIGAAIVAWFLHLNHIHRIFIHIPFTRDSMYAHIASEYGIKYQ